jgi:hypothetical protein
MLWQLSAARKVGRGFVPFAPPTLGSSNTNPRTLISNFPAASSTALAEAIFQILPAPGIPRIGRRAPTNGPLTGCIALKRSSLGAAAADATIASARMVTTNNGFLFTRASCFLLFFVLAVTPKLPVHAEAGVEASTYLIKLNGMEDLGCKNIVQKRSILLQLWSRVE